MPTEDADVGGPAWLAGSFAVLMVVIAAVCAFRLVVSWRRGKRAGRDADALHVLMGVVMAGMLDPRLYPMPGAACGAVFGAAAGWFAWQALRARGRVTGARWAHPTAHTVECTAMVYMLLPVGSWPSGRGQGLAMPGTGQGATVGNPVLTLVLALFMLGYALWAVDRLAVASRARAAAAAGATDALLPIAAVPRRAAAGHRRYWGKRALAPRVTAYYKIAMAVTMGYMLVTML